MLYTTYDKSASLIFEICLSPGDFFQSNFILDIPAVEYISPTCMLFFRLTAGDESQWIDIFQHISNVEEMIHPVDSMKMFLESS